MIGSTPQHIKQGEDFERPNSAVVCPSSSSPVSETVEADDFRWANAPTSVPVPYSVIITWMMLFFSQVIVLRCGNTIYNTKLLQLVYYGVGITGLIVYLVLYRYNLHFFFHVVTFLSVK